MNGESMNKEYYYKRGNVFVVYDKKLSKILFLTNKEYLESKSANKNLQAKFTDKEINELFVDFPEVPNLFKKVSSIDIK